ncbi:MAG TPA: PHP domain-containing protein [Armatimonadota bacterium]|nr:PHP domain-containing protein [Armatimonadota bacterium]
MIDLHSHTTASDGSCTPTELVHLAREKGLSALGVADHDTVDGLPEAAAAARDLGIDFVPGIEISVDYPQGEFHLLGYYVDFTHAPFLDRIRYLQDNRVNRNGLMVRKMQELGFDVTLDEIIAESGGGQVGRPHMARVLMKKGYVSSVQDAFDRYLADGKPLHVPKVKLDPAEAIDLVHSAGGVAVVAHPKYMEYPTEEELAAELGRLKEAGLDGLECYYSQHTEAETEQYLRLARRFGFLVTAGSDFHGISKPDVPLGVVYQGRGGEDALLGPLKAAAGRA